MHFHMTRLPGLISSCFNSNRSCMVTDLNDDNCMFWFQWSTDVQMALLGVTLKMDTATPPTMARTMSVTVRMATSCSLRMVWMAIPSPELKMAWHRVMSTTWTTPVSVSVTESYNYDTWTTLVSLNLTCSIYYMDNTESLSVNIVIHTSIYLLHTITSHGNVTWIKVTAYYSCVCNANRIMSAHVTPKELTHHTHTQLLHICTDISLNIFL